MTDYILTGDEFRTKDFTLREWYGYRWFPMRATEVNPEVGGDLREFGFDDNTFYVLRDSPVQPQEALIQPGNSEVIIPATDTNLFDPVQKAEHYNTNLPEGIDVMAIIATQTKPLWGLRAFFQANIIKYVLRWQKKNGVEDLKKARAYIDRLIEEIENND